MSEVIINEEEKSILQTKTDTLNTSTLLESFNKILKDNNIEYDTTSLKSELEQSISKHTKLTEDKLTILFKKLEVTNNDDGKFLSAINKVLFLKNTLNKKISDQQNLALNHKAEIERLNEIINQKDQSGLSNIENIENEIKAKFEKELENLKQINNSLETENKKINAELQRLNENYVSDMNSLNEKIIAKETQYAEIKSKLVTEIEALKAGNKPELNGQIIELNKTIQDISNSYKIKNDELMKVKVELEDIKAESIQHTKTVKKLDLQNEKMREEMMKQYEKNGGLESEIQKKDLLISNYNNEVKELRKHFEEIELEKGKFENDYNRVEYELKEFKISQDNQISRMEKDYQELTLARENLIRKNSELNEEICRLKQDLESNKIQSNCENKSELANLKEENEKLNQKIQNLENNLKELTKKENKYVSNIENLNIELNSLTEKIQSQEKSLNNHIEKQKHHESAYFQLKEEIKTYITNNRDLNEKIKEYETKLTEQSKSERKIKEELSSKINELEQKLQNQSNQFDIKRNELLKNFENVQSEKNGLENKIKELDVNNRELANKIHTLENELNHNITLKEHLESEINILKSTGESSKSEVEEYINKLKEEVNIRDEKINEVTNIYDQKFEEINKQNKSLNEEKNKISIQLTESEIKIKERLEEIKLLEKEKDELKSISDKLKHDLEIHHEEYKKLAETLKLKPDDEVINSYQTDITSLKEINEKLSTKIIQQSEEIRKLEENIKSLSKENENKTKSITILNSRIENQIEQLTELKNELQSKIKEFKDNQMLLEEDYKKRLFESDLKIQSLEEKTIKTDESNKVELVKNKMYEVLGKIRDEVSEFKYLIDKRIISNIILHYFDKNNNEKIRSSLVDTLAGIMGFNDDERRVLGLAPNYNSGSSSGRDKTVNYFDRVLDILQSLFDFIEKL